MGEMCHALSATLENQQRQEFNLALSGHFFTRITQNDSKDLYNEIHEVKRANLKIYSIIVFCTDNEAN